jgi:putative intracellular protease/amidase
MAASRAVHVLVFDGFADWEPAHALAELRRWGRRTVKTVGFTGDNVLSMGGLRVVPDLTLEAVQPADVELLLLPGGDLWESDAYPRDRFESLIAALLATATPIAAICAATVAIGRAGALNDRRHTSNAPEYLATYAREYTGGPHYVDAPAVRDRHVITASGLCAVDFARAIFAELGIFSPANEALWFDIFKQGRLPQPPSNEF